MIDFKKHTLKSGVRAVLAPMKNTETVTVLVGVFTGSKNETKDLNGISHFLEHMMFKGTEKRPTALDIAIELDAVGGHYNAFTSKDYTAYYTQVAKEQLDLALDIESDIFLNSTFKQEEVDKERGVILEEINMYEDDPRSNIGSIYENLLYGDQPAGWDIIGTRDTVGKMSRDDFVKYFSSHYIAEKTVVAVAGNFDDKKALAKLEKLFAQAPKDSAPEKKGVTEDQKEPGVLVKTKKTDQTHLTVGFRSYNLGHKDRYTLALLANILGGGMSSRMFVEVREQRGLAYYVGTSSDLDPDAGHLTTQAGVSTDKLEEAITTILEEYKKIRDTKVPAVELKRAKENIRGRMALRLESSYAVALYLADQEIQTQNISRPTEVLKKIDAVTAEDIQRVAKDIMKPEGLNLAVIGPQKDDTSLKPLLSI